MRMGNRTLYVSDLDGTLLTSESRVSEHTASVLNALIAAGAMFTVATARTPATVTELLAGVNVELPMLTLSGSALWDNKHKCYTRVSAIPQDVLCAIADVMERHGVQPFVYRQHGALLHTHHYGEMSVVERRFVEERKNLKLKKFFLNDKDYRHNPDKAILMFSHREYEKLRPVAEELREKVNCQVMFYHDIVDPSIGLLEVYAQGCTKAAAVSALAKSVGADRIVVFGDNRNDIPMFKVANHSVAMGNAFDEVKREASEVIGDNDHDSVALWIEQDFQKSRTDISL